MRTRERVIGREDEGEGGRERESERERRRGRVVKIDKDAKHISQPS